MKKNNPIIPMRGVCDPHIHIFNNIAYLYAIHDKSIDNLKWCMSDWQIWSSADLVNWEYESTVRPEDTYIGESTGCWAVDAASINENALCIEIFNGNKQIGCCEITKTSGYHHCGYEVFSCDVDLTDKENINLTLRCKGNGSELMRLHWFKFV